MHPTENCEFFPRCRFGADCLKLHPPCRYGDRCTNMSCLYEHGARHRRQTQSMRDMCRGNPMLTMMSMMNSGFRMPSKRVPRKP